MISSLIDELNKSADEWNGSTMFELARMCREAADTIWELRDDLQRANADNAKLRELVQKAVAFVSDEDPCGHCGHDAECYAQNGLNVAYEGGCLMLDLLADQARELEVEVTS